MTRTPSLFFLSPSPFHSIKKGRQLCSLTPHTQYCCFRREPTYQQSSIFSFPFPSTFLLFLFPFPSTYKLSFCFFILFILLGGFFFITYHVYFACDIWRRKEMRRGKASQEEEEFGSKKTGPSSFHTLSVNANTNTNTNINNEADGKDSDKAKAIRSKHSVTEQRRRSKINERFQILRDRIPNTDQKRDTASFLLEVIEYVQFLQEKVQKYEGSYQGWSSEPTKLMPWRNSHWRGQSFVDQPQAIKNDPGLGSTFSGKLDENNINITPSMIASALDPSEADPIRDNEQAELAVPIQGGHPLQRPVSEAQTTECLTSNDTLNQQDDLAIEGGTISISSVYSQGLLNTLTQALQRTGLDLSQANISVQIDLGKRSNRGLTSSAKESANGEDSNPVQKRLKK